MIFAIALAPAIPGYQLSKIASTLSAQGMVTAPPVSNTTIVFGLALATALTSASWSSGGDSVRASRPSLVGWLTNTTAISDLFARLAADAESMPASNSTFALGAPARIALSGDDG